MNHLGLVWANLRQRRAQNALALTNAALVFSLYGLAFGLLAGMRATDAPQLAEFERQLMVIAIAISGIGIVLILVLTIASMAHALRLRQRELGILSTLGFSNRRIIVLVVLEAVAPSLAGAMLGLLSAPWLFGVLASQASQMAQLSTPLYTPAIVFGALLIAVVVPALGCVAPAWRIVRLDPAVALTGRSEASISVHKAGADPDVFADSLPGPSAGASPVPLFAPNLLRQVVIMTVFGFATLHQRLRGALLIVGAVATMVFVLLFFLSMAEGIRGTMLQSGDPTRVMLRHAGTTWLWKGEIPAGLAGMAATAPGVARAADGSPMADATLQDAIGLARRDRTRPGATTIMGVGPHWREMSPTFELLSGRMPRPDSHELIMGHLMPGAFRGLETRTVMYKGTPWQIVGTFRTGGWWDGYLVGDYAAIQAHSDATNDSLVLVKLESPEAFDGFRRAVASQLPPGIIVEREADYYASYWRSLPKNVLYVAFMLGTVLAIGATTGTAQIMHGALEERRREIATFRVLGFDGRGVAVSAVIEAVLLATLGAFVGATLIWVWRDGVIYNAAWSVIEFTVNGHLLLVALAWSTSVALLGTSPLALRMMRQRAVEALQNLRVKDAGSHQLALTSSLMAPTARWQPVGCRPSLRFVLR